MNYSRKLDERRKSNKDFSSIEMSLIDQHKPSQSSDIRKTTFTQFKRTKEITEDNNSP